MGQRVLIDTDILIDYVKGKTDLEGLYPYISEITLYEFIRGAKDPAKAKELLEESFNTLWINNKILILTAEIWKTLKNQGTTIDDRDLIIGATAITHNLKLYTGNKKHFNKLKKYGLQYL
jgi:hypothetical protein